ncbi:MAG: hypothetical protein KAV82_06130 [Phycisphaerae bacterium]|nr:hypothetical protein [Phycisphaerae bacterium]
MPGKRGFALSTYDPRRFRALTLVECLLASVILAVAVVAVTQAVVAGQMQTVAALHRSRGVQLAEALMDEVLRLPYADPDGTGGEVGRSNFDNLEDFNGFNESPGALSDAGGTPYGTPFQGFSRAVTVTPANGGSGINVSGFGDPLPGLTVTVVVQDTAGATWTLTRFRAQPPP